MRKWREINSKRILTMKNKLSDYFGSQLEIEDLFESIAAKHGLYFYKKEEFLPAQIRTNSISEILNNPFDDGADYVVIGYFNKFRLTYRIGKLNTSIDLDENLTISQFEELINVLITKYKEAKIEHKLENIKEDFE